VDGGPRPLRKGTFAFQHEEISMQITKFALAGLMALTLAACNEQAASCTAEDAQAKMGELTARMTELGASDPAKLEQFSGRAAELQTQFASVGDDPQAACDAIDALMAEMQ
jgi:hypothetical protein